MDINPENDLGELIECQKGYSGYKYSEEICKWFSAAIGKDVIVIRSPMIRKSKLNPKRLIYEKNDLRKTFTTDAAFHIIGKKSVKDLERRVDERYPEGLENNHVSTEQFRPNIVLDTDKEFDEDNYFEMRVGACLMRNCGPTIRCNTIRLNLDKNCRVDNCEPYNTLGTYRTVAGLGILFGMYYQQEILYNSRLFSLVLPKSKGFKSFDESDRINPVSIREADGEYYVTVRKKDPVMVRVLQ